MAALELDHLAVPLESSPAIIPKPNTKQSLRQNQKGHTERPIGSIRQECLDHTAVFGERHLRQIQLLYTNYYTGARTHLALNKGAPLSRAIRPDARILTMPIFGGLHHQYVRI